ncbi:MAG TPA: ring-hydroxylating oxygenase subunit alpha [Burkholderiaceae bacterium]|jgi:choline monooxygenase|nr:ring-hydroxylating oxygenase subunit alpha [Burkholderiaceae bacterium]
MTTLQRIDICSNPDVAYTMPASYYTDAGVFRIETERIFARSWIAVLGSSDVREPNAYATALVAGDEIFVVRGQDGVLRAFYNVCPHRAHQLVRGCGKARNVIVCPYHAWTFGLDGKLARARNCENVEAFDASQANLSPVRVEELCGLVYVNLDPDARPLREEAPGLEEAIVSRLPGVNRLIRAKAHQIPHTTRSNWKAIVDNYLECYHCAPAHPGFVRSVDMDTYHHDLHGAWTVQIGQARPSSAGYAVESNPANPTYAGFYLWPTAMINITPGNVGMMTVNTMVPVDADTTVQYYDFYLPAEEPTVRQMEIIAYYRDVFRAEDLSLVESVQRGLKSRGYRGRGRVMVDRQRSAISEHGVAHFHHRVAQVLQA